MLLIQRLLIVGAVAAMIALSGDPCYAVEAKEALDPAAVEFFEQQIRPLLLARCTKCHGDAGPVDSEPVTKGGLGLTSRTAILSGGDSGPAAVPGKPKESLLLSVVGYADSLQMPPDGKLPEEDIARLTRWVEMGMPWPAAPAGDAIAKPAKAFQLTDEQRQFWSFQPVRKQAPPTVQDSTWPRGDIDRFILAPIERQGLKPAPRADKHALLRRATFDLTGLPPTPAEIEAFVADDSDDAFAKVVDRLLASPAYGERFGRRWLDVVRYADSRDARYVGASHDITEAWRYRDWVVTAFNRDMPYNDFIVHQIAGDLLPTQDPSGVNADGLVASGFLAIGEWGTGDADAQKMYTDIVDDQVNAVCRGFLGLTMSCARCHDHKFDPLATADYYALAGIFFSTQIATPQTSAPMVRVPLVSKAEVEKHEQYLAKIPAQEANIKKFVDEQYAGVAKASVAQTAKYLLGVWDFQNPAAGQPHPALAEFAASRGLREDALSQWIDYLKPKVLGDPLLSVAVRDFGGQAGVHGWKGAASEPIVAVNTNDQAVAKPAAMPPRSLAVHPGPTTGVAVGWKSPLGGSIRIAGRVADTHAACGDGVDWVLEHCSATVVRTIGSGTISDGGTQPLTAAAGSSELDRLSVNAGDFVRLVILPKASHACDMTAIELEITEHAGQGRVWNLVRDLLANPLEDGLGNPHSDSYANRATWHFYDCLPSAAGKVADRSPQSALAPWFDALGNIATAKADRTAAEQAASKVQQALNSAGAAAPLAAVAAGSHTAAATAADAAGAAMRLYQDLASDQGPFRVNKRDEKLLSAEAQTQIKALGAELELLKKNTPPPLPVAMVAREGGVPGTKYAGFHDAQVHVRGRYDRLGEVVPRGFPQVLGGKDQPPITAGSGRLELARWLARPENPLTARVMVNRIWQHHFGAGIVRTPGNFGKQGEAPTHPELLDYLATQFVESGWSVKAMHRMMMLSATYQQSAYVADDVLRADVENRLFARAPVRRLEAEAIRDTLLTVAGKLDPTPGGPAVRDAASTRRTLYLMTIRSVKSGFSFLFDVADPEAVVDQRNTSTVAPQSLFLMNNEFILGLVPAFTERVRVGDAEPEAASISRAYKLLYGRSPSETEAVLGQKFLERARKATLDEGAGKTDAATASRLAWQAYCQALLCANEMIYVD